MNKHIFGVKQPARKNMVVVPTVCGNCGRAIYFNETYKSAEPNSGWFHQDDKLSFCHHRAGPKALPFVEIVTR